MIPCPKCAHPMNRIPGLPSFWKCNNCGYIKRDNDYETGADTAIPGSDSSKVQKIWHVKDVDLKNLTPDELKRMVGECSTNPQSPNCIITTPEIIDRFNLMLFRGEALWRFPRIIRWLVRPVLEKYWEYEDEARKEVEK